MKLLCFFSRLFFPFIFCFSVQAEENIRIAISDPQTHFSFTGENLEVATLDKKKILSHKNSVELKATSTGIMIDKNNTSVQEVEINTNGFISVNNRLYRNSIEIKWRKGEHTPQLILIHSLPLETYVIGIVSSEVPKNWPLEALKAQAIAARTYVMWQKSRRSNQLYHVKSSVLDQVYNGAQNEHPLAQKAVLETKGQIITYKNQPIQAYFHSNCGGHTESAKDAWDNSLEYLPGTRCSYCKSSPKYKWTYTISKKDISKTLYKFFPESITRIKIDQKTKTGRAKTIKLLSKKHNKTIPGETFRAALGYNNLRSTLIDHISIGFSDITFTGRGHGHGVGMCQWGALDMASSGILAEKIIAKYYPGTEIKAF